MVGQDGEVWMTVVQAYAAAVVAVVASASICEESCMWGVEVMGVRAINTD